MHDLLLVMIGIEIAKRKYLQSTICRSQTNTTQNGNQLPSQTDKIPQNRHHAKQKREREGGEATLRSKSHMEQVQGGKVNAPAAAAVWLCAG